jgi:hypothetical protein
MTPARSTGRWGGCGARGGGHGAGCGGAGRCRPSRGCGWLIPSCSPPHPTPPQVAHRATLVYFLIAEFAVVNCMYQTSLAQVWGRGGRGGAAKVGGAAACRAGWDALVDYRALPLLPRPQFNELYEKAIDGSERASLPSKRISNIIEHMTHEIYLWVARGGGWRPAAAAASQGMLAAAARRGPLHAASNKPARPPAPSLPPPPRPACTGTSSAACLSATSCCLPSCSPTRSSSAPARCVAAEARLNAFQLAAEPRLGLALSLHPPPRPPPPLQVKPTDLDVFLKGGGVLDIASVRKKPKEWIPDTVWLNVVALSAMDAFRWAGSLAASERVGRMQLPAGWLTCRQHCTTHPAPNPCAPAPQGHSRQRVPQRRAMAAVV